MNIIRAFPFKITGIFIFVLIFHSAFAGAWTSQGNSGVVSGLSNSGDEALHKGNEMVEHLFNFATQVDISDPQAVVHAFSFAAWRAVRYPTHVSVVPGGVSANDMTSEEWVQSGLDALRMVIPVKNSSEFTISVSGNFNKSVCVSVEKIREVFGKTYAERRLDVISVHPDSIENLVNDVDGLIYGPFAVAANKVATVSLTFYRRRCATGFSVSI